MIQYTISIESPQRHFLKVSATFPVESNESVVIQLPAWRPGRYELGNFAKNVKDFTIKTTEGIRLPFQKTKKDQWLVNSGDVTEIVVEYLFYANSLNAGSTYLDENQLYVNPVNCLVYREKGEWDKSEIYLDIPESYQVAIGLEKVSKNRYTAQSFHQLADAPFIASDSLKHKTYNSHGVRFNLWFQGEVLPVWDQLIDDFQKFTDFQIEKFGGFPVDEYHFYFQISTAKAYHGVEHLNSTVIYLGPSYEVFKGMYTELLGVSSHELYHAWNVKAIRPEEMLPYDYSQENYSRLGFVAEGVTTYMGDRILFESGVFDMDQYHKELGNYIIRHFHGDGRKHMSVGDASFDTWLDGYDAGIPGRKTSIYVEGCLIAYICDMKIRRATNGEKSLHDVMREMYQKCNQKEGYSESTYRNILEQTTGESFQEIFDQLINGITDFTPFLEEALAHEGWNLERLKSVNTEHAYGIKGVQGDSFEVKSVLEGSSAYESGVVEGDIIHAINGIDLKGDLHKWLEHFRGQKIYLQIKRNGKLKNIPLLEENEIAYYNYKITTDL